MQIRGVTGVHIDVCIEDLQITDWNQCCKLFITVGIMSILEFLPEAYLLGISMVQQNHLSEVDRLCSCPSTEFASHA